MAFDWTQLEGYRDDMTPDEKLSLLEKFEPSIPQTDSKDDPSPKDNSVPSPSQKMTGFIPKAQFDKVSSELAAAKKQLKSKMTEDEQREAERLAAEEAMKTELETLKREKTLSNYKASYLSQGYDEVMAEEAATAMADGDMETVFSVMRKHVTNMEKSLRAKILKDTPVPPAGDESGLDGKKKKEMADLRASFGLPPLS